jgi:hypothetical protein
MGWNWSGDRLVTLQDVLEGIQVIFFWPGDTIISWLVTHYPQLATSLGLSAASCGGLASATLSVLVGWSTFIGLCHLMLWMVQLQEALVDYRHRDSTDA